MKKLEALYKENVKRMRNTLESKLMKAAVALEEQRQERMRKYARFVNKKKNKIQKTLSDNISGAMKKLC